MRHPRRTALALALVLVLVASAPLAAAGLRAGLRVVRMEPRGADAEDYSKASWGGGIYVLYAPPGPGLFAFTGGFDVANMLSQTVEFRDRVTGLRIEQQTNQWFSRFYVGGRFGPQGHGFIRPYAGANIALVYYSISTDVVIPDDRNYEDEIRQNLEREGEVAFGFDFSLGIELKVHDRVWIDGGAKYLKSFGVPQQLGADAEKIHPEYIQAYLGVEVGII